MMMSGENVRLLGTIKNHVRVRAPKNECLARRASGFKDSNMVWIVHAIVNFSSVPIYQWERRMEIELALQTAQTRYANTGFHG